MDSANLDTPPATPSPPSGTEIVAERYRLVRKLGEGAMGAVFLAEHVHMRKRFALKILHAEAMASPEIVARFEREAVAAGNIAHPGVCAATDFGRLPDGGFFLVLEYVEGDSLRTELRRGPLRPVRAVEIVRQILAALGAAHAKGVVHRDVKPENVMVTPGDVVKVLDFGIAKVDANTLGDSQGTNLTRMGAIYGTPVYMAPEQAMGKQIDHRVDLYAVGIMLHEMLTGRPPFDGDGIVILARHVNDPPPPIDPSIAPPPIEAFVRRLLAKNPSDRPADAAAAIAELDVAKRSLDSFESSPAEIATSPTVMGGAPSYSGEPGAQAATVAGAASPSPPPASTALRDPSAKRDSEKLSIVVRDRALTRLTPLAKRIGIDVKLLAIAIGSITSLLMLLLLIVLLRPSEPAEEEEARKPRKRPTASSTAQTKDDDQAKSDSPKNDPSPSPSGSASGGKGGGGIKGIGRKIKSLF